MKPTAQQAPPPTAAVDSAPQHAAIVEHVATAAKTAGASSESSFDGAVMPLNPSNIKHMTKESGKSVLVDFFAPWCPHCKELAPTLKELAQQLKGDKDVIVASVDCEENQELAGLYDVKGFPTLMWFPNGADRVKYTGDRTVEAMAAYIADSRNKAAAPQLLLQTHASAHDPAAVMQEKQAKWIAESWEPDTEVSKVCALSDRKQYKIHPKSPRPEYKPSSEMLAMADY